MVAIAVPDTLSADAMMGQRAFDAICATCHGTNATGKMGFGPPLVHKIYEPSHHADMSFVMAVQNGAPAHHWQFGDMPPQAGLTKADVGAIISPMSANCNVPTGSSEMTFDLIRRAFCGALIGIAGLAFLSARAEVPVTITARVATPHIAPPKYAATEVWTYDGALRGPVLRVPQGGRMTHRLVNDLPA